MIFLVDILVADSEAKKLIYCKTDIFRIYKNLMQRYNIVKWKMYDWKILFGNLRFV